MRRLTLLALVVALFVAMGCKKDDECTTGNVRFTNISSDNYSLFVNEIFQAAIPGNRFLELDLREGAHDIRLEQQDGWVLFPTIVEDRINVFGCQESGFTFP